MIWPLWPGCAFLVAVLLLTPRKVWPAVFVAGLAGFALYDVQEGLPIRAIGLLLVADSLEILIAALGVTYVFGGVPRLNSVKSLAKYSLFAGILAPIFVASAAASALGGDSWWVGFFTEALALLDTSHFELAGHHTHARAETKGALPRSSIDVRWISDISLFHVCGSRQWKPPNIAIFTVAISVVGGVTVWNHRHQQLDRACRLPGDLRCRPRARSFHRRYARK